MKEIWKKVPDFPGYEISNQGQVRSYFCQVGMKWEIAETPQRILRPARHGGYRGVLLGCNGKRYYRRIGRLVLLAFVGPPPDGMEICHNDGDSLNDRLDNLRYDTHKANMQDALKHGSPIGAKPKLNQRKVHAIRAKFASGKHSRKDLAREFGVSYWLIIRALKGQGPYDDELGPIQNPCIRLNDQQAEAIRKQRVSGKSLADLAEKYGISESAISRIASGKRHGNAGGPRIRPWEIYVAT